MRPKVGQYFYTYHGTGIRIYQYTEVHQHGTIVSEPVPGEAVYFNREDARKRVYELNGWKYKSK